MADSISDMRLATAINDADAATLRAVLKCISKESPECRNWVKCRLLEDLDRVMDDFGAESASEREVGEREIEEQDEEQGDEDEDEEDASEDEDKYEQEETEDGEDYEKPPRKKQRADPVIAAAYPAEHLEYNDRGVLSLRRARDLPNVTRTEQIWEICTACGELFDTMGEP